MTVKARTLTISLAETSAQDDMTTGGPATTADGGDGTTTEATITADDGTTTAGDGDGDGTTAFLGTDVFLQRPDPSSVIALTPENPCFWMESHDGSISREPTLSHKQFNILKGFREGSDYEDTGTFAWVYNSEIGNFFSILFDQDFQVVIFL